MTWELLSATVCFHISFMYSGNNIKVEPFVIQPATHLNIFVSFSCEIYILYVVLIFQTDNYDNKDDWRWSLASSLLIRIINK